MTARRKPSGAGRARERGTGSITSYRTKGGLRWRFEIPACKTAHRISGSVGGSACETAAPQARPWNCARPHAERAVRD